MSLFEAFRDPRVLVLLVIPAVLLFWTWTRQGRSVALPVDHAEPASAAWPRFFLRLAESLPALLLFVAILLAAGPLAWGAPRTKRQLANIQFCVDVSGSMRARFGEGTRYDASMVAINRFLDYREGDAFGLTFFGTTVLHWVPLTSDVSAFRCAPPFMEPGRLPYWFNGTSIGKALLACRDVLVAREEGDRMIILVSDGRSSDLYGGRDEEIARELRDHGIVVHAVYIGSGETPDSVVRITSETGGTAFTPGDTRSLDHVFEQIDAMQKARLEKTRMEAADDFAPYCLAGLSLLATGVLCLFGLRYTPW